MTDTSSYLANHVKALPKSKIRELFALAKQMDNAVSLGIGEPDFTTPWRIREASIYALEKGKTSYTDNRGLYALRTGIADFLTQHFNVSYDPDSEIIVTIGTSQALDSALRALINPGDKILYHEPCYVSYHPGITLSHGIPIIVKTHAKDHFKVRAQALREAWEPGCKALVLNFPTNPTGGVIDKEELQTIADFAHEKDLIVITDEIYAELTYEHEHTSIASLKGMKDRTLFMHGFSKNYAMTGFRVGYVCGPQGIIEGILKIHQYGILCAPILSQEAAIEALKSGWESVQFMRDQYKTRRDYIVKRFNDMGLTCHLPHGAFYSFPSITSTGLNEVDFTKRLLQEEQVAVVPGSAFGKSGEGFIRASFATSYNQIIEATKRIERFLQKLNQ